MRTQAELFLDTTTVSGLAQSLGLNLETFELLNNLARSPIAYERRHVVIRGRAREVAIPIGPLRDAQRRLSDFLWPLAEEFHESCIGYVSGGSAKKNAEVHCGNFWIQKLDVEDFYPSTTTGMIESSLRDLGASEHVASAVASIATLSGSLPMGAPSSPILSNIVLRPLDFAIAEHIKSGKVVYSRYADDLTFSSMERFDAEPFVREALESIGLRLNRSKTRLRCRGQRVVVTGLTVSEADGPRLPKQFKRRLRQELHYVERFGLEEHSEREYEWGYIDPDNEERQVEQTRRHIEGKLRYARSVEPVWVQELLHRFPKAQSQVLSVPKSKAMRAVFFKALVERIRERDDRALEWVQEV
ncbi:reverse transcriptase family protein [Cellulosimicrobium cellulans]|uniref:reverse transcriptase family protein n=1 Tax=Cellulosimicrobium cellulans TaxID=1710 RepID=UPI0036EE4DD3